MSDHKDCPEFAYSAVIALDNWLKHFNDYRFVRFCKKEIISTDDKEYKEKVLMILNIYIDVHKLITQLSPEKRREVIDFVEKFLKQESRIN